MTMDTYSFVGRDGATQNKSAPAKAGETLAEAWFRQYTSGFINPPAQTKAA